MRREFWAPFLAALAAGIVIYGPYLLRPVFSVDSHPFPLHVPMLTEGRWGLLILQGLLQGASLEAVSAYYAGGLVFMALAGTGMARLSIPDRSTLQQSAMAMLVVANAAWVMLTPWGLHFLAVAFGLVLIVGALWAFERLRLFGTMLAAIMLTFSFSLYQQNAILAGCVWLIYALAELPHRPSRLLRHGALWAACVIAGILAYLAVLHYGYHAWVNTGGWRESASPFPKRLLELNLSRVRATLEAQYMLFMLVWVAFVASCVAFSTKPRTRTAVAMAAVVLLGFLATYAFTIGLGLGTYERMLMPLFFTAMLTPVAAGRGLAGGRVCAVGAVTLVLVVGARAHGYHGKIRHDNDLSVAIVKHIYSRIDNPNNLPIVLVGNRSDCSYGKGDIPVLCNYWRSHLFKGVTGNPRIESFSDVGKPDQKAFAASLPVWPARGFANQHEGVLYARIGPESSWEQ